MGTLDTVDMDEETSYDLGVLVAPNGFKLKDGEKFLLCPFENIHVILNTQMQSHLFKCRRAYIKKIQKSGYLVNYSKCKFNPEHLLIAAEVKFHEETCPYRRSRALGRVTRRISTAILSNPGDWDADQIGPPSEPERKGSRSPTPIRGFSRSPNFSAFPSVCAYSPRRHPAPKPAHENDNGKDLGYGSLGQSKSISSPDPKALVPSNYRESWLKLPVFHRTGDNLFTNHELDQDGDGALEPSQLLRDVHKHILGKVNLIQARKIETMDSIEKEALEDWDLHAKMFPPPKFDAFKNAEYKMYKYMAPPPGLTKAERKEWRADWAEKMPRVYDPRDPDFTDNKDDKNKIICSK